MGSMPRELVTPPRVSLSATILAFFSAKSRAAKRNLFQLAGFLDNIKQPARRSFIASLGTADGDRFAGDHAMRGMADGHRIGVHDPRHGLRVGVDVRRGNIHGGPDDR